MLDNMSAPAYCWFQVVPPSTELRTAPPAPVAMQAVAVGQLTATSARAVPDVFDVHVPPPLAVTTMVPAPPTATHDEATQLMLPTACDGVKWPGQVAPPSDVQ